MYYMLIFTRSVKCRIRTDRSTAPPNNVDRPLEDPLGLSSALSTWLALLY